MCLKLNYKLLIVLVFLLSFGQMQAGDSGLFSPHSGRMSVGLNYNAQLNYFEFAPSLQFKLNEKSEAGVGLSSIYYMRYSTHDKKLGGGLQASYKYFVKNGIYGEAFYTWMNLPYKVVHDQTFRRIWKADIYLGAGYRQQLNQRWSAGISALYNINYKVYSTYDSRVIFRVGAQYRLK